MDSNYLEESNKIASPYAWLSLVEITTTGYATPLRYTNNNSDVSWGGNTYTRMPFRMDDVNVSTSGEFPEFKLEIGDVDLAGDLRTRVAAAGGLVGSTVRFMVVHSDHLTLTTAAVDEYADILSCELTNKAVVFTIGTPNLLTRRLPRDRYVPGYCRHRFEGSLCQYVQPSAHPITTDNIVFSIVEYAAGHPVRKIAVNDKDLSYAFFNYAEPGGTYNRNTKRLALAKNTGFTISGTTLNDGFFLADNWYAVQEHIVYVFTEADGGRVFYDETVLTGVTLTLGYDKCDHTLEACRFRDNSQNYGGSPGIAGGIYG